MRRDEPRLDGEVRIACFLVAESNQKATQNIKNQNPVFDLTGGVIKTLPEIASKFLFTSSRCELPYQLPLLISLRSGIKSQSIAETIFLTFYRRKNEKHTFF